MAKRHLTHKKTKKKITIYVPKSHEDKFGKLQDKNKGFSSRLEKDFLTQLVKDPKNMPKGYYASKGNLNDFGKALKNLPSSSLKLLADYSNIVIHPIDTAKNILQLGKGVLELAVPDYIYKSDDQDMAIGIGSYFKDRYGSMAGFRKAATSDPAGILADVAMIFSGGASGVAKIPQLAGQADKINKIARISNRFDPVIGAGFVGKEAVKAGGNVLPDILGFPSGVGGDALRLSYRAGSEGGQNQKVLTENMRNQNPNAYENMADLLKLKLKEHKDLKQANYREGMGSILLGTKTIPKKEFNKIIDEIITSLDESTVFKGKNKPKEKITPSNLPVSPRVDLVPEEGIDMLRNEKGITAINDIKDLLKEFRSNPNFHTVESLDVLKGMIDDLYPSRAASELGNYTESLIAQTRNKIKNKIVEIEPEYANVMAVYEQAHQLEKELIKAFSVNNKASVDTISRKLFQTLRNNQNTNFGSRLNTLKQFDTAGELQSAAAGLVLQSPTPIGLRGTAAGGAGIAGVVSGGGLTVPSAGLLAASSPRLMGEASNLAGRIAGTVNQMSPPPNVTGLLDAIPQNIRQGISNTAGILKEPITDLTLLEARAIEEENN
tara:strand:+ start:2436 stop:4253 length:1818 start_codon:yes stop_codon:yes gene_type:complete